MSKRVEDQSAEKGKFVLKWNEGERTIKIRQIKNFVIFLPTKYQTDVPVQNDRMGSACWTYTTEDNSSKFLMR
jgi:hypothetical protein